MNTTAVPTWLPTAAPTTRAPTAAPSTFAPTAWRMSSKNSWSFVLSVVQIYSVGLVLLLALFEACRRRRYVYDSRRRLTEARCAAFGNRGARPGAARMPLLLPRRASHCFLGARRGGNAVKRPISVERRRA